MDKTLLKQLFNVLEFGQGFLNTGHSLWLFSGVWSFSRKSGKNSMNMVRWFILSKATAFLCACSHPKSQA